RPLKGAIVGVPLTGVALAALTAGIDGFASVDTWRLLLIPACFVAVVVAERFPVKIGPEQKINLGALPCLVAALLLPAGIGPATAALSVLAGNLFVRRPWPEGVYNAGNTLAAASLAAMVGTIGSDVDGSQDVRAAAGAAVYVLVNLGLAVLPASLHSGRPYLALLQQVFTATWPASLTLAACAVTFSILWVEAVSDSVAEAERMKRMLARLRSLAHADEDVPLRRELVDLAELTDDVVRAYAAQAATSGVELVADVGTHAQVSVDKDLLREAV